LNIVTAATTTNTHSVRYQQTRLSDLNMSANCYEIMRLHYD